MLMVFFYKNKGKYIVVCSFFCTFVSANGDSGNTDDYFNKSYYIAPIPINRSYIFR